MQEQHSCKNQTIKHQLIASLGLDYYEHDLEFKIGNRNQLFEQLNNSSRMSIQSSGHMSIEKSTSSGQSIDLSEETKHHNKKMMTKSDPNEPIPIYVTSTGQSGQRLIWKDSTNKWQVGSRGRQTNCIFRDQPSKTQVCYVCQPGHHSCNQTCNPVCFRASQQRRLATQQASPIDVGIYLELESQVVSSDVILNQRKRQPCACKINECAKGKCNCLDQQRQCTEQCECIHGVCKNFYSQRPKIKEVSPKDVLSSIGSSDGSKKSDQRFPSCDYNLS